MTERCPCDGRVQCCRGWCGASDPCPHWPPPVEQTDPAARRVAWVLWAFCAVLVAGCACCARPTPQTPLRAKPPAYGHRVV